METTSIVPRIVRAVETLASGVRVAAVRIGLSYTAIELSNGRVGVSYTFRDAARCGCASRSEPGRLAGRPARELIPFLGSSDPIEAALGLATVNALANDLAAGSRAGDVLEHLELQPDEDVGMVGRFGPLVAAVRKRARCLTIFERVAAPEGDVLPAEMAREVLPRCRVALITATAILNHTIDALLRSARTCREVVVLGPSTPLLTEAFEGSGVTRLSGVTIRDREDVMRIVSEGGGMRTFRRHVDKVNLAVSRRVGDQSSRVGGRMAPGR